MDLTLACKRSLSTFLMIFLAISLLTVGFNLILAGVIPLLMYLSVNILWLLYLLFFICCFFHSPSRHRASVPYWSDIILGSFLILLYH